jgi:energy-coupling factor transporter transmembrane protein EcfT
LRTSFHELWGCARGPVSRLAPQTRLLCGAGLLGACMLAPATSFSGASMIAVTAGGWPAACRLPGKVARAALAMGLVLFLPYLLLVPVIHAGPHGEGWRAVDSLAVPWSALLRGVAGVMVSVATAGSLSASDLHDGLVRLPVPRVVSDILVQIVHQTGNLIYESGQIAAAMAVRGATGRGRTALAVLWSLPRVWLPRVMERAERIGAAMEMREYGRGFRHFRRSTMRFADALALALVVLWLGVAATARYWGWP